MGYLRGVFHGALIGGAVALLYAPKPGRELRQDLNDRLDQMRGQMQPVIDQASDMVDQARPQVEKTINKAQQTVRRRSGEMGGSGTGSTGSSYSASSDEGSSGTSYAGPASMGTGTGPAPNL
jgi:gas vesicle protein